MVKDILCYLLYLNCTALSSLDSPYTEYIDRGNAFPKVLCGLPVRPIAVLGAYDLIGRTYLTEPENEKVTWTRMGIVDLFDHYDQERDRNPALV